MVDNIYSNWENTCEEIVKTEMKDWKKHPDVIGMLQHVWELHGKQYLENLVNVDISLIREISTMNDVDGAILCEYEINSENVKISPTTLRYLSHSMNIINKLKKMDMSSLNLVEIGGGYGGLCLVLNYITKKYSVKINKYFIYDLPGVQKLQKYYLKRHEFLEKIVEWKDSSTFGDDLCEDDVFLISNYALSEMDIEYRKKYLENLLPKSTGGFFVWNSENDEGLPFKRVEIPEVPQTGTFNKVITF